VTHSYRFGVMINNKMKTTANLSKLKYNVERIVLENLIRAISCLIT